MQRVREAAPLAKILLIDADTARCQALRAQLGDSQVDAVADIAAAAKAIETETFAIVMLDARQVDLTAQVESLRAAAGDDAYFIALTVPGDDWESGYCAGLDGYLERNCSERELRARIEAGLNTVGLRQLLREARAALADNRALAEAVDGKSQLLARLQAELARTRRYRRSCSVLVVGVAAAKGTIMTVADQEALTQTLRGVIRMDVDTPVLYVADPAMVRFGIVLPETGPAEVAVVRSRIRSTLLHFLRSNAGAQVPIGGDRLSIGAASADPATFKASLRAQDLLDVAEQCLDCMCSGGASRLHAVRNSVVSQVAIPCRYGYAVADHCLELQVQRQEQKQHKPAAAPKSARGPG
jgi:hypothetical protein